MPKVVKVGLMLMGCANLTDKKYKQYLNYLSERGAKIQTWDSEEPEEPNKVPRSELLEPGGFTVSLEKVEFRVSTLLRSRSYLARFECPSSEKGAKEVLKPATKHIDELFELLAPAYGFIDLLGDEPPDLSEAVDESRVRWLFWWNYFGREFVATVGKSHLEKAPFLQTEDLPKGALKCSTRALPFERIDSKRAKELISYFGGPSRCDIYDAAQHPIDF